MTEMESTQHICMNHNVCLLSLSPQNLRLSPHHDGTTTVPILLNRSRYIRAHNTNIICVCVTIHAVHPYAKRVRIKGIFLLDSGVM